MAENNSINQVKIFNRVFKKKLKQFEEEFKKIENGNDTLKLFNEKRKKLLESKKFIQKEVQRYNKILEKLKKLEKISPIISKTMKEKKYKKQMVIIKNDIKNDITLWNAEKAALAKMVRFIRKLSTFHGI